MNLTQFIAVEILKVNIFVLNKRFAVCIMFTLNSQALRRTEKHININT